MHEAFIAAYFLKKGEAIEKIERQDEIGGSKHFDGERDDFLVQLEQSGIPPDLVVL
ncbi:hypothetical protein ACTHOQ_06270 [Solibacillus silvestris]|uniref:hypothetical protein n=1 Tax=Solibacillus silvestris TaxID=76853 RepID=UPI003F7E5D4A